MSDQEPLPPLPPEDLQVIPPAPPQEPQVLPYAQAGDERPGILTALGIVSIVLGGLGTLTNVCGVFQSIFYLAMPRLTSAMIAAAPTTGPATMPANPFANLPVAPFVVAAVLGIANLSLAIYLIVCGAIVLRSRVAGRKHHMRYAILKFVVAVPAAAVQAWSTYAMQDAVMASMPATAPAGAGNSVAFAGAAIAAGLATAGVWLAISVAYPIAVVIVMRLKQVRGYYAQLTEVGRY